MASVGTFSGAGPSQGVLGDSSSYPNGGLTSVEHVYPDWPDLQSPMGPSIGSSLLFVENNLEYCQHTAITAIRFVHGY